MNAVTVWLYALMVWLAPPDKLAARPQYPGWEESESDKQARYQAFAEDLYAVVYDPAEAPLFGGHKARAHTAALVLAVAYKESGFAADVDRGPCYRGKDGRSSRCDGGQSACTLQIKLGRGSTAEGWDQSELFADRKKCFRAGLALMRRSYKACSQEGPDYRLNAYASGVCGRGYGKSRERIALARRILFERGPVPQPDQDFLLVPPAAPAPESPSRVSLSSASPSAARPE